MSVHYKSLCLKRMFHYGYGDEVFSIDSSLIPEMSLLYRLYTWARNKGEEIAYSDDSDIGYVLRYVQNKPIIGDKSVINVLNYWGVYRDYNMIYTEEKHMRVNMYKTEYDGHEMNTDKYHMLTKMDTFNKDYEDFLKTYTKPDDLLFFIPSIWPVPEYVNVVKRLQGLDFLFTIAKEEGVDILVAGEYVYKMLMDEGSEVVPVECSPTRIKSIIGSVHSSVRSNYYKNTFNNIQL